MPCHALPCPALPCLAMPLPCLCHACVRACENPFFEQACLQVKLTCIADDIPRPWKSSPTARRTAA
eukprot:11325419-Alexandrium_andersonii.AAC.1